MKVKPEWIDRFRGEASGNLAQIKRLMDGLDWNRVAALQNKEGLEAEQQQLRSLFIKSHSIKGTAGMLGLSEVAQIALELEALWGATMLDPTRLDPALARQAEAITTSLRELVETIKSSEV